VPSIAERRVVQRQLWGVGALELTGVGLEGGSSERSSSEPSLLVTRSDSVPEHLERFIQKAQLYRSAECAGSLSQGITLIEGTPVNGPAATGALVG
jgi:hypothetical protein